MKCTEAEEEAKDETEAEEVMIYVGNDAMGIITSVWRELAVLAESLR